mgnify:CR=1 FL=1
MGSDIKSSYGLGWGFALAFPLIFLVPPVVEFIQHVIEWRLGVFDSVQKAEALSNHPIRLGFGFVKLASLLVVGLWISRYRHSGGDRKIAGKVTGGLFMAFIPVIIVALAWEGAQMAAGPWLSATAIGQIPSIAAGIGLFVLGAVFQVLTAGWRVGVPLRDRRMGFFGSIWKGLRVLPAGLVLYFVVFLPLLVLHTGLNVAMALIGLGPTLWVLFGVDALLVGYIATAVWGVYDAIYRRGLAAAGQEPVTLAA